MNRPFKASAVMGVALAATLVLSACAGTGETSPEGETNQGGEAASEVSTTLSASHPQEPTSWNWLEDASSAFMVPIYLNVLESLFETGADGSLSPLLAESYEVSPDGLVYTISLREATFHDGSDFDSADVVSSLTVNATSVNGVVAAPLSVIESMETPDPRTVVISLSRASNDFRTALGTPATMMSPEGYFDSADVGNKIIGTGPFSWGEYRADVELTMNRFEDYWGEKPYMETVIHRFMADETASINAMRAGELDVIGMLFGAGVEQVASFEGDANFTVRFSPSTSGSYLFLNPSDPVMQDLRVRQAISHAIDRGPVLQAAVGGYAEPNCVYVPNWNSPWNSTYCPYPYDPERAKELLAEAGYADGLTIDFPYLTIAEFPASFEVFSAQLAAVGITVEARGQDLATWFEQTWNAGDYQISHITNNAALSTFGCEGDTPPFSNGDLCDEKAEQFIVENDSIVDPDEYVAGMRAAAEHAADIAWMIAVFAKTEPGISSSALTGFAEHRTAVEMDYRGIRPAN